MSPKPTSLPDFCVGRSKRRADTNGVSTRLRTIVVLIKLCFATGVLSIPAALGVVGYGPGLVLLAVWSAMTTCECSLESNPINKHGN